MTLTKVSFSMTTGQVVNVLDFIPQNLYAGIVDGTNTTDLRANINAAFTHLAGFGGGTLFFPKGTYLVSEYVGNTTNPAGPIDITVEAELGTILDVNPPVFANYGLYLQYPNLVRGRVFGLRVQCNNKVSVGILLRNTDTSVFRNAEVERCEVYDCNGVNNAGVTAFPTGIYLESAGWGYQATVRDSIVIGVSRDKANLPCTGITVVGCQNTVVENNTVYDVTHNSTNLLDADGIKVFSHLASGSYKKSAVLVLNNTIENCDGRFIKLQTKGSALVEGNLMRLTKPMELIEGWTAVDSQVADANIINNRIYIGSTWTGGSSAALARLSVPDASNVDASRQIFVQRFSGNDCELRKTMAYGVLPAAPANGVTGTCYLEVCDNNIQSAQNLNATSNPALSFFMFVGSSSWTADPADFTAEMVWNISDNKVASISFIHLDRAQADYTGKWFLRVQGNLKYGAIGFLIRNTAGGTGAFLFPYTSDVMVQGNHMGTNPSSFGLYVAPLDSTKLQDGSDFATGDSNAGTISPAPANYLNGRFGRGGNILFAETVVGGAPFRYISNDSGSNWYQV